MTDEEALRAPFLPKSGKPANGSMASRKSLNKRFSSQKIIYGSIASGENGGPDQIAVAPSRASAARRHSSYHEHPHTPSRKSDGSAAQARRGSLQGNAHSSNKMSNDVASSIIGVAILEVGVLLHSFVIGLTLATVGKFLTLFIVITLHRESYSCS